MANANVVVRDNRYYVWGDLENKKAAILEAIGQQAESYAKLNITEAGRVDTGRMRNSVTHTVVNDTVYIGSNLEYAVYHELGTGIYASEAGGRQSPWAYYDKNGVLRWTRGVTPVHFLRDAISQHEKDYVKIITDILKV